MSLPWAQVNECSPAEIAGMLELPRSPHGGRKRFCPFCGGRNFSPLKRAFYCYSGCGGKAYSNVDTAAAHWQTNATEACMRLAAALGISVVDSDPPWAEVAAATTTAVAAALELTSAPGEWRWDCPSCGGSGTLRSYQLKWRCTSPPCACDERRGWRGHVDLAMAVWRTTPADACFRLAHALRGIPAGAGTIMVREPRIEEESPRVRALAALRRRPGTRQPREFYGLLLRHLRLGPLGRRELVRRRIDLSQAEAYGFRSTEPGEWSRRILPFMAAFTDDELTAAGFPPKYPGRGHSGRRPWWPGYGRAPLLVIPFRDGDDVAALRFRNLADPEATRCPRYVSPIDVQPDVPFAAAALSSGVKTLLAIEGELNAFVALSDPYRAAAFGLPGASCWQDEWASLIPDTTHYVVGCFDADKAGRLGAARVRDSLATKRGFDWAHQRWRACFLERDNCEMHVQGELAGFLRRAPWISQDVQTLWADPIER